MELNISQMTLIGFDPRFCLKSCPAIASGLLCGSQSISLVLRMIEPPLKKTWDPYKIPGSALDGFLFWDLVLFPNVTTPVSKGLNDYILAI